MTAPPTSIGAPPRFGRFFLPGPTEVHPDVLEAQTRPMIGHRGQGIQDLMGRLQEGLRALFVTDRPVFVSTSSATGLMEAGVRNAARQRVLSLTNGAFSERFAEIAAACGFDVDTYAVPWGEAHDPGRVRALLAEGAYDTVTVVQSETSTGVLNDVEAIAEAVR
ncbi:MAG: aminotransferase class V-fold PLP-dependent enzyme, partial [Gemmatimonadetes bacterium]|nr:aminotransferase class V-fold PLP-dependent enzyme [Gemmatimonadota bacterium]